MALRTVAHAIVIALALAGPFALAADAASRTAAIQGFAFPALTVSVGDTVTWQNLVDGVPHTATSDTGAFDTGPILPGTTSKAVPFVAAGTYAYHCAIHSTMHGTITVLGATPSPTAPPTPVPTPVPTPPSTVAPTAAPTASPSPSPSPSASPSPSPSPTVSPTAPATGTPIIVPTSVAVASPSGTDRRGVDAGQGPGPIIAAGALVVAVGLGGVALFLYRRR